MQLVRTSQNKYRMGALEPRWDVSLYGDGGARTCARYWALKCSFYLTLWRDLGAPVPYEFTDADHRRWHEPEDFTALAAACHKPRAQPRFRDMRALRPQGDGRA